MGSGLLMGENGMKGREKLLALFAENHSGNGEEIYSTSLAPLRRTRTKNADWIKREDQKNERYLSKRLIICMFAYEHLPKQFYSPSTLEIGPANFFTE